MQDPGVGGRSFSDAVRIHPAPAARATWSLVTRLSFGSTEPNVLEPGHR